MDLANTIFFITLKDVYKRQLYTQLMPSTPLTNRFEISALVYIISHSSMAFSG